MRKLLLLLAIAVAVSLTGYAQSSGTTQSDTTTGKTTTKASDQKLGQPAAPKPSHLTGCLAKNAEGNGYVLTNGKYTKGVAVKTPEDISAHVGHEVKLTGNWEKSDEKLGTEKATMRTFDATSLKHIADTCNAASTSGGKKGEKKTAEKPPAS